MYAQWLVEQYALKSFVGYFTRIVARGGQAVSVAAIGTKVRGFKLDR
jgi:hypothetical protein